MKARTILLTATVTGVTAVMTGAFGAHGLKEVLARTSHTAVFETAVRYQFYHTFLLLVIGILALVRPGRQWSAAAWCSLLGIVLFSGSLYTLSLTPMTWPGPVTPVGGLFFIASWVLTAVGIYRMPGSAVE